MVQIIVNQNRCKLQGNMKSLNALYTFMSVKNPNAWFLRKHMPRGWDGKMHYLSEAGTMLTGLLPMAVDFLEKRGETIEILQDTDFPQFVGTPKKLGKYVLRDYQYEAVSKVVNNKVCGKAFPRGLINAATNAGKTLIAAGIYRSYKNAKAIVLVNNTDLFNQFQEEIPELVGEDYGFIKGKQFEPRSFTVAMVQTLSRNIKDYGLHLAKYDIVLVDECDLSTSKSYKNILKALYNAKIRVGLSGTIGKHKNKLKNWDINAYFGDVLFNISKQDLIKRKFSAPLVIKILEGNTTAKEPGDYDLEYQKGITHNTERLQILLSRVSFNIERDRKPILIIAQYHAHVEAIYREVSRNFPKLSVSYAHHKVPNRKGIMDRFRKGKLDILVSSMIVKRGLNFPLTKVIINAGGGDSAINLSQIMGRGERTHESKSKTIIEDFFDLGRYLQRHSKHRIAYYKQEGFKVILLYKKKLLITKKKQKRRT